ncbi:MAG TPA: protein translocase subunit SecD, partial [Tepidisphaeraceae bacterium]
DLWTMQPGKMMQRDGSITQTGSDSKGRATQTDVPGVFLAQVVKPQTGTGRVIAEANKAFALLAKTESGATYAYKANVAVDDKLDSQIASTLRNMQPGALKTVSVGASARIVFLRSFRPSSEQIQASHILISYKGATGADATITRTKAQALAKAKDLKAQLDKGADLNALASKESDGPSRKDGGRLGSLSRGTMAPAFDAVAFAMKQRQISEPVDTPFGYDIIRLDKGASTTPAQADYDELKITGKTPLRSADALVAKMQNGQIKSQESAVTLRTLFFSLVPSGWKSTALDGKHFRSAAVSLDPVTNVPVVQIAFDTEGAKIFQELTKKNIGKQIAIFVGGQMVSAPRVQSEISGGNAVITGSPNIADAQQLAQDLNTGAIPAPIHLTGQYTVEATLGSAALQTSLMAALIGIIILMLYMIVVYRGLGVIADVSLVMYALLLFAILKLPLLFFTSDYIVLTLAGMAGIILSIGMAVDANVLVFERMKEEFRKGKIVKSSVESSFKHAWPAIRDGNVSTLITCAILFLIGTSIVRGFAVTLGMGVILSMFTSFWITRLMLRRLADSPYAKWLDPYNGKGPDTLSKSEPVAAPAA